MAPRLRRWFATRLVLAALLLISACDGCGRAPSPALDAGASAPAAYMPPTPPVVHDPAPVARVTRVEGEGASVRAGALEAGAELRTGDATVVIDFRAGGRIELSPHSLARLGEAAPQELILASGLARGLLPPAGNSPRPPLRLASAAGVVELPGAGDVLLAALPEGRAWVACVGGSSRLRGGELGADGRPMELTLVAGQAVALTPTPAEPMDVPSGLDGARALASGLLEAAEPEAEGGAQARSLEAQSALLAALEAFEGTRRQGETLRQRQRELARTDAPAARALLPRLVEHSRSLIRGRERLLVRQERAAAVSLALGQASPLDARVSVALDVTRVDPHPGD